jgi:hypothetical protein
VVAVLVLRQILQYRDRHPQKQPASFPSSLTACIRLYAGASVRRAFDMGLPVDQRWQGRQNPAVDRDINGPVEGVEL